MAAPRRRTATILTLLAQHNCQSVVDLGCGSGELLREIRERFPPMKSCGIDLSAEQIEENRKNLPSSEWVAMDLNVKTPLPARLLQGFDAVVASEIIEHLEHPEDFLAHALSLATPGGFLIITTQSGMMMETEKRVGHIRHFSTEEMRRLLTASGWRALSVWNEGWPFHDWSKKIANRNPDAAMRRFSDSAYGLPERALCFLLRTAFRLNSRKKGAQLYALAEKP